MQDNHNGVVLSAAAKEVKDGHRQRKRTPVPPLGPVPDNRATAATLQVILSTHEECRERRYPRKGGVVDL
ncbi:MAG: hypothetical protein KDA66_04465, partial [Planctomycetaceae bacterium]|nr:hypothetical protein [Planctomycetaceae bacterium]